MVIVMIMVIDLDTYVIPSLEVEFLKPLASYYSMCYNHGFDLSYGKIYTIHITCIDEFFTRLGKRLHL